MRPTDQAPIPLSSARERASRRRALAVAAAASEQAPARRSGRAWINGREVAPNPSLAHLTLSYD